MVGGRKTHEFPHGTPRFLVLNGICFAMAIIAAVVFEDRLLGWRRFAPFIAVAVAFFVAHSLLLRHYERTGKAVPLRPRHTIRKFGKRLPFPMLLLRLSFFITVAVMLFFGIFPVSDTTARNGIVACVFVLLGTGVLNLCFERHYVKVGIAEEVEL